MLSALFFLPMTALSIQFLLQFYTDSIGRGRNVVRAIKEGLGDGIIYDIEETDEEVLFKFHSKHMKSLEPYLKPRNYGASISPFSSKNLDKNRDYKIPDEDLLPYKSIIEKIPQNNMILVSTYTKNFLKSISKKKNGYEQIKADMILKGLKSKEYIHSIGVWEKYLKYMKNEIDNMNTESKE